MRFSTNEERRLFITAQRLIVTEPDYTQIARCHKTRADHIWGCPGCAIGIACEIPHIKREGLRLASYNDCLDPTVKHFYPEYLTADGQVFRGWYAVEQFYGLTSTEAEWLFNPDKYTDLMTPQRVACRIFELITRPTLRSIAHRALDLVETRRWSR